MIEGKNKTDEHGRNLVSYLIFMEVWVRTLYIIRKKYCKRMGGEQKAARLEKVAESRFDAVVIIQGGMSRDSKCMT